MIAGFVGLSFKKVYGMGQDNPDNNKRGCNEWVSVFGLLVLMSIFLTLATASFFQGPVLNGIEDALDTPLSWAWRTDVNPLQGIVGAVLIILMNVFTLPLAVPYWFYTVCAVICGVAACVVLSVRLFRRR